MMLFVKYQIRFYTYISVSCVVSQRATTVSLPISTFLTEILLYDRKRVPCLQEILKQFLSFLRRNRIADLPRAFTY